MSKNIKFLVCEEGSSNGSLVTAISHREAAEDYFIRMDPVMHNVIVYQLADDGMNYTRDVKVRHVKR